MKADFRYQIRRAAQGRRGRRLKSEGRAHKGLGIRLPPLPQRLHHRPQALPLLSKVVLQPRRSLVIELALDQAMRLERL